MMSARGAVTPRRLANTELADDLHAADRGSLPAAFKEIRGCS